MKTSNNKNFSSNRFIDVFKFFPKRMTRLILHFWEGAIYFTTPKFRNQSFVLSIVYWWWELGCHVLDTLGIAEGYEAVCDFTKKETRPLNAFELIMAKEIFGDTINYERVRIDETAEIACKSSTLKYVSFYTINSWGRMSDDIFIHEMVHIWQYENVGAVYIPKALRVHLTEGMGYNYGGLSALEKSMKKGGKLLDFNYEQQGDIVADYFRIKCGYPPIWGKGTKTDLKIYEYFVEQLGS